MPVLPHGDVSTVTRASSPMSEETAPLEPDVVASPPRPIQMDEVGSDTVKHPSVDALSPSSLHIAASTTSPVPMDEVGAASVDPTPADALPKFSPDEAAAGTRAPSPMGELAL